MFSMFRIIIFLCEFAISVYFIVSGYFYYQHQRIGKSNTLLIRENLVDVAGYTKWYGKHQITMGIAFLIFTIAFLIDTLIHLPILVFIGFAVCALVFIRYMYHIINKTESFYIEKL